VEEGFVRKFDATATELWTRDIGFHSFDSALVVDAESSIYVAGTGSSADSRQFVFVRKYRGDGSEVWTRELDNALQFAAAVDNRGAIYVTGAGPSGVFLTKLVTSNSTSPPGDINGNGIVDCPDLVIVRATLGTNSSQPAWDARADVVVDNQIDVRDLAFVAQRLPAGTRCQ
jgi:hypothetical protein